MFVTKVELHVAVKLIQENIREELASKITDYDAASRWLIKKAFAGW